MGRLKARIKNLVILFVLITGILVKVFAQNTESERDSDSTIKPFNHALYLTDAEKAELINQTENPVVLEK